MLTQQMVSTGKQRINSLLKVKKNEIAITRPWIIKLKNKKILFYSFKNYKNRGRNYNIGLAVFNKKKWNRIDKKIKKLKNLYVILITKCKHTHR